MIVSNCYESGSDSDGCYHYSPMSIEPRPKHYSDFNSPSLNSRFTPLQNSQDLMQTVEIATIAIHILNYDEQTTSVPEAIFPGAEETIWQNHIKAFISLCGQDLLEFNIPDEEKIMFNEFERCLVSLYASEPHSISLALALIENLKMPDNPNLPNNQSVFSWVLSPEERVGLMLACIDLANCVLMDVSNTNFLPSAWPIEKKIHINQFKCLILQLLDWKIPTDAHVFQCRQKLDEEYLRIS